jgi:pimeloyl-ACP methyl ester carboxylesterase
VPGHLPDDGDLTCHDGCAELPPGAIVHTELLIRPGTGGLPPLVLLHGIGSNAAGWAPVMAVLDPRLHAIAWEAPGYGGSMPLPPPHPSPADYAPRLEAVLDAFGLGRVVLAGHSLGTLFAAAFAAGNPQRVAALALFSPSTGHGADPNRPLPGIVQQRIDDFEQLGPVAFAAHAA